MTAKCISLCKEAQTGLLKMSDRRTYPQASILLELISVLNRELRCG